MYVENYPNILVNAQNVQRINECSSNLVMNMVGRLLLCGEKGKRQGGLVISKFPELGFDKPLPKAMVAIVIILVCILAHESIADN